MSTPQPLDRRILAELHRSADTLGGLTRRLGSDAVTVQRTLQQLGSLKLVTCHREDGQLLWDVAEPAEPQPSALMAPAACAPAAAPAADLVRPAAPAATAAPAPVVAPGSVRAKRAPPLSGALRGRAVTDRLRRALRDRPWQGASELLAALPDVKRDVIYALLSQRVKAGEFVAYPATGRFRRYAHAGARPPEGGAVAQLKCKRVKGPQLQPKIAGVASAFELCLRFIAWARTLHGEPTIAQIRQRFEVSRATAFRWRDAWRAAQEALAA